MQAKDFLSLTHEPRGCTGCGKPADVIGVSGSKPLWQQETKGASHNLVAAISKGLLGAVVEGDDELLFVNRDDAIRCSRHDAGKKCKPGKIVFVHPSETRHQHSWVSYYIFAKAAGRPAAGGGSSHDGQPPCLPVASGAWAQLDVAGVRKRTHRAKWP
jgi:hypothetical protein